MPRPELSLVIPIYNEEEVLPQLEARLGELLRVIGADTEVVFVDDGSKDRSLELLRLMAQRERRYRVLSFSRNFGHQRAITAGVDKSRGEAVVVMDADLQDPPEVIVEMVAKWRAGYDVVYGRRRSRQGESFFKLITAKVFYRVFAAMIPIAVPLDTGDFRLMSRRVVQTLRALDETHRFVRGLVAWVGFKQTAVEYDRHARFAGETKYPLKKMLAFAADGIASFSIQPLRFATYLGVLTACGSIVLAIWAVIRWQLGATVTGWTTTFILIAFLFSVQFFMIGVLGEYVGRIYEQSKKRPLYVIAEKINFGRPRIRRIGTRNREDERSPISIAPPGLPIPARTPSVPPVRGTFPSGRPSSPPGGRPIPTPSVPPLKPVVIPREPEDD